MQPPISWLLLLLVLLFGVGVAVVADAKPPTLPHVLNLSYLLILKFEIY